MALPITVPPPRCSPTLASRPAAGRTPPRRHPASRPADARKSPPPPATRQQNPNIPATRRPASQNAPAATDSGSNARARLPPAALVVYRNHNI
jgi:hypothetical protein